MRSRVFISGKVQGVFFRANTKREAEKLGLKGWVKNVPDGRVEAVFEGDKKLINKILQFIRRGPESAEVEDVEVFEEPEEGVDSFEIRH